ncbi:divalent metal cation transporter [Chelatococcus reniformis]|uniref:divalent metal cation transporter n=1 Tax=Chelatococcus reniformis TaxID=1494448 RepID=UPI001FCE3DA7|nr:divalent metal cation transporter [Chelatococcus reniformis]
MWTAPVTLPMMYVVVYLSSKLGQVSGRGLFHVIKDFYRWLLWRVLIGVLIGNTVEAAADLGGMAAAINLFVPLPIPLIVAVVAIALFVLQIFGSYTLIRNLFRWLALALLAYVGAAILAKPDAMAVLRGTLLPTWSSAASSCRSPWRSSARRCRPSFIPGSPMRRSRRRSRRGSPRPRNGRARRTPSCGAAEGILSSA